ncbi:hypothetical protein [Hymenobacter edaphi]|nr:hypothetical protein [Hymenobacter edaphi]
MSVVASLILLTPPLFRYVRALMLYDFGSIWRNPTAAQRRVNHPSV